MGDIEEGGGSGGGVGDIEEGGGSGGGQQTFIGVVGFIS